MAVFGSFQSGFGGYCGLIWVQSKLTNSGEASMFTDYFSGTILVLDPFGRLGG
jgi:hypothetical protein